MRELWMRLMKNVEGEFRIRMVSVEALNRNLSQRLAMNRQILNNKYWFLPYDNTGHENYVPVGRGVKSSDFCGRWVGFLICNNIDAHNGKHIGDLDCTGKVIARHKHMWCNNSSCPVCFIRGWSVRSARGIVGRLDEGFRRGFGEIEHITVSPAVADRDLPEVILRKKCREALIDRGISGSCMIFHGFRENRERNALVWSPHYHCLGFVEGGFGRCRECVHSREDCASCDGLKGREVRGFAKDGYLVKVLDKRKTAFGTAFYQCNHATLRSGVRRFHCVTYWGNVSYSRFESKESKVEVLCPVCGEEMHRAVYVGKSRFVKDIGAVGYAPVLVVDPLDSSGEPNFVDVVEGGRYEG
jgi:hypothetical protein